MIIRPNPRGIQSLQSSDAVAESLRPTAEAILGRAQGRAPSWVDASWFVRAGVGPEGAYAQAIARGSGTVAAEYGGIRSPAYAYFRSSI